MTLIIIILVLNFLITFYLLVSLKKQKLKNRIIESFISWIIRSMSDYHNSLTDHEDLKWKFKAEKLPILYENILENICLEFDKDSLYNEKYIKNFLSNERQLFIGEEKTSNIKIIQIFLDYFWENFSNNRWFFQMYLDFYDKYWNEWVDKDFKKEILKESKN